MTIDDDVCGICDGIDTDNCPAAFHVVSGIRIYVHNTSFEVRYPINRVRDVGVNRYGVQYVEVYCADGSVDTYVGVEYEAEVRQ